MIYVKSILYDFDSVFQNKKNKYIFQNVTKRKLIDVYHSHNFFEVCFVKNGSVVELYNGKERILEKGSVVILKPGDSHCYSSQSEDMRIICLSVEKTEALNLLSDYKTSFFTDEIYFKIEEIDSFLQYVVNSNVSEYHCKLLFCMAISLYLDNQNQLAPYDLQSVILQMQRFENMKAGIERLVQLSGYSRSHLTRLVRRYYGVSLQELIMNLRLDCAYKEILFSSDCPEEVAAKVGYSSFSHFNKIFKLKFGISPALLRKTKSMRTI